MNTQSINHLLDRINNYLDNELSEQEESLLLTELKTNPQYVDILKKESSFRNLIKTKLQRRTVSPILITSIKEKIRLQAVQSFNSASVE